MGKTEPQKVCSGETRFICAIFLLALFVRVVFVFQWSGTPYGAVPWLDAQAYHEWAKEIADGQLLRGKAFYQSPLFPYLLGLLYAVFGQSFVLVGLMNALFGAGTAALLAYISSRSFGRTAGWITGLLFVLYRPSLFYTAPLMKEPLGLFLLALSFWLFLRAIKSSRLRDYAFSGAMLGLGVLVRGNFLLLVPVALALAFAEKGRKTVRGAAAFLLAMFFCIAPATLHNYVVSDSFVLVNYTDGFNLYIGNSPSANGTNRYPPEVSTDPIQEELNTIWSASEQAGRNLGPAEVSAFWRDKALAFMIQNPLHTLRLIANKFEAFWNSTEQFDNYDATFIEKNFRTILSFPLVPYWLITTLAVIGGIAAWPANRRSVLFFCAMTVTYMGTVLLFYVTDRYRLPVVIFLLPLAGAAVPAIKRLVEQRKKYRLAFAFVVGAFVLFLGLKPPLNPVDLEAFNWGTLCMIYSDKGEDGKALEAFDRAQALSPVGMGASAYVRASYALEHMGQDGRAQQVLEQATDLFPQNGIVLYNLARFKSARRQLAESLPLFEKARALSPFYLLNYYALAKGHLAQGDDKQALAYAQAGLNIDSSNPLLNSILQEIKAKMGQRHD